MEYTPVKNAHIVPRMYLERFAVDGRISVYQVLEKKQLTRRIEEVGTRSYFYRRRRADGTTIDDVEWSLAQGEGTTAPILKSLDERWPLQSTDKVALAEIFAYQVLRGPKYKREYEAMTEKFIDDFRSRGGREDDALDAMLVSNENRFIRMFAAAPTVTSILGSMHWTLVTFRTPVIATGDEPITFWPGGTSSPPCANLTTRGHARMPRIPTSDFPSSGRPDDLVGSGG